MNKKVSTHTYTIIKDKGKVVPAHAMRGYRGSGNIAVFIPNLSTRWELYSREGTPVPVEWKAGQAAEPVWTFWRREKSVVLAGT
jgi:hypothetical protein